MAFPDDLLELARYPRDSHPEAPHQASLRRAVSTAYYALFHLLVVEATANWDQADLRPALGRCFDHGPMKAASETRASQIQAMLQRNPPGQQETTALLHLQTVARAFIQAQQRRNDADYNLAKDLTTVDVNKQIDLVSEAFRSWGLIRTEPAAQAYLVSLLGSKERRPSEVRLPAPGKQPKKPQSRPRNR